MPGLLGSIWFQFVVLTFSAIQEFAVLSVLQAVAFTQIVAYVQLDICKDLALALE